jgi:alpha-tubulin suppressor-like RCC1 family protein
MQRTPAGLAIFGAYSESAPAAPNPAAVVDPGHNAKDVAASLGTFAWLSSCSTGVFASGPRLVSLSTPSASIQDRLPLHFPDSASDDDFVSVSASAEHACVVTRSGKGYAWGAGAEGQLGNGQQEQQHVRASSPCKVLSTAPLAQVACGSSFTTVLTQDGRVFAFGKRVCLGIGVGSGDSSSDDSCPTPHLVTGLQHDAVHMVAYGS